MGVAAKLNLESRDMDNADETARKVLERAQAQVGFIPNLYANMVNSPGLLETYLEGYRLFRESGCFTPVEQEVVFLAISRENGCNYCMAAHSMIGDKMSGLPEDILAAIRQDETIPEPQLDSLYKFSRLVVRKRGWLTQADIDAFIDSGFSERHVLEIVLAAAVKTISNYVNHLFNTEVDEMFDDYRWTENN